MIHRAASVLPSPTSFNPILDGSSFAALHQKRILNVSKKLYTYQIKPPRILTAGGTSPIKSITYKKDTICNRFLIC